MTLAMSCSNNKSQDKKGIPINSLNDLMTNLSPTLETFEINSQKDSMLIGEKGTTIYFPPNVFQFSDGTSPNGKIKIELKECYNLSTMIAENLSTLSYDQILKTGGMLFLKASADGKELSIKDGESYIICFPKNNEADSMDLFYNVPDRNNNSTWVEDYKLFQSEKFFTNQDTTSLKKISNQFEFTDDLYDYKFLFSRVSVRLWDLKFKGSDDNIVDFLHKKDSLCSRADKYKFYKNKIKIDIDFQVDKKGNVKDLKITNGSTKEYNQFALAFYKDIPQFDLSSSKWSDSSYSIGLLSDRNLNLVRFKAKFRDQYADYKNKVIQKMDKTALDYFIFSASKLGWINCDKDWNTNDEKIDFIVKTKNSKDSKVQLVFSDIKSIMNGILRGNNFVFRNVPINRKIKIIGISFKDGKPTMSKAEAITNKNGFELNEFKEFTLDDLETELNNPK